MVSCACSLLPMVRWSGRLLVTTSRMRCASGEGLKSTGESSSTRMPKTVTATAI